MVSKMWVDGILEGISWNRRVEAPAGLVESLRIGTIEIPRRSERDIKAERKELDSRTQLPKLPSPNSKIQG